MTIKYLEAPGEKITKDNLKLSKARKIVAALEGLPFYSFVECRKLISAEIIVFDAEVQLGQKTVNDIRNTERIAVTFYENDDFMPEVLALREDFPLVPHVNLRPQEKPRSLCLYDQSYDDIKLRWTATFFLERIREWLSLTAKGELHSTDQPLEPLLSDTSNYLVFPFDALHDKDTSNNQFMIVKRENFEWHIDEQIKAFMPILLHGNPQTAGVIARQPKNVEDLDAFLKRADINLLSELREKLKIVKEQSAKADIFRLPVVLIVVLPKKRAEEVATAETTDVWAFLIASPISIIGQEIGIWEVSGGHIGYLMKVDESKFGQNLKIEVLNTIPSLTKDLASIMSGLEAKVEDNLLLIGAGALGSQILINLVRMGVGNWTIIDDDCLLPHNLARHALPGVYLGQSKALKLAEMANGIIQGKPIAKAMNLNMLHPHGQSDKLNQALNESQTIIDVSTSIPIARYLARDAIGEGRRMSVFLNPLGSDVVVLAEDGKREQTLDCLEMQYYRYLISEPLLEAHLKPEDGPIRYARSCRDVSSRIPQDLVALHAAIASRKIYKILSLKAGSSITIWRANKDSLEVMKHDVPVFETVQRKYGEWILSLDHFILNKIREARKDKRPNETGGILMGSFDTLRKIIYVVDCVLSPPDSIEKTGSFARGREGLKDKIKKIEEVTLGNLTYIGEWHSHPIGVGSQPSAADAQLFAWLLDLMNVVGLPPLMLIAGEHDESVHLEQLSQ